MNLRGIVTVKYRDTNYNWVDVTDGILQVDITRGIPQYLGMWSQCKPGQLRLRSRNFNLDPARNPEIDLLSIIRIAVNGTPIFTGKIFDTNTEYFPKDDPVITIDAFDELGVLSQMKWGNDYVISHDYSAKEIIGPINFGSFLQRGTIWDTWTISYPSQDRWQANFDTYCLSKPYSKNYHWPDYSLINGTIRRLYVKSSDVTKYPLTGYTPIGDGIGYYDITVPTAGHSSDSIWKLPDWDAVVISNPSDSHGYNYFGTYSFGSTYVYFNSSTSTGISPIGKDGIACNVTAYNGSRSGITQQYHPLYGKHGFWSGNRNSTSTTIVRDADWAALYSTDDDNAYQLWLKCEQSEAGFGFVDAYNRFRHYSRAVVDNDVWHSKATFASNGSGISYNSIKVTNGWESVVKGVRIDNLWSSNVTSIYNLRDWKNVANDDTTYIKPTTPTNRDNTTTNKMLNVAPTTANPYKKYTWLPDFVYEIKGLWEKFATTNSGGTNYVYDTNTRDWDVEKLSTKSYFQGEDTINGNNQLSLSTNYAWTTNCEPGGYARLRDNTKIDFTTELFNDNVLDRQKELATEILANYSTPITDIRTINFSVHPDDLNTIKELDIFDRITIDHNDAGLAINNKYAIMGITHTITPDNWDISYQLWNEQHGRP